jgi:iron complex outermembrane receptor protein
MLFIATISLVNAQNITVKGTVKDKSTGEPLVGVSVIIKGGAGSNAEGIIKATATDIDGNFTLVVPSDATLVVSYIGYKTLEIKASDAGNLDIAIEQDTDVLDEVVVVGYGTADKRDVASSLAKVSSRDFNKGIVTGVDNLIEGKVAGLQITPSAEPGGGNTILLRGLSINGQSPLIVVDGIILDAGGGGTVGGRNPLNFINPNDIESITVLKDAQATAIYGVRGANGVLQITTKNGKTGKPTITYDGSVAASFLTRRPDILDATEFRAVIRRRAPQELPNLGTANTDWIKEVTRIALSTQHNVAVSGGFKKTNYFASANYLYNEGVLRFTSHSRLNASFKVTQKLFKDNLNISLNSRLGLVNDELGPNVMGQAVSMDPTRPVRNSDGTYFQWPIILATDNPVAQQENTKADGRTQRSLTSLQLEYKIPFIKGLSLTANGGLDNSQGSFNGGQSKFATKNTIARGPNFIEESQVRQNLQFEYYATYKKSIKDHNFDIVGGYGWYDFKDQFNQYSGDSLVQVRPEFTAQNSRLISFYTRANYNFKGKYLIGASLRRDGSSRFGEKNRWGYFPSISAGWRIIEENFAKGLRNVFHELKVRGSYGIIGNDQIGNYQFLTIYSPSTPTASYQFGDTYQPTIRPSGVDPNIKWEQTETTNLAIDMGFFNGRLNATVDFYRKNVNDLLFRIPPPAGTNLSDFVLTNIGKVRNEGVELLINAVPIDRTPLDKNGFRWNTMFNISYNENVIIKLDNREGEFLRQFEGYRSGGISGDIGQTIQIRRVGLPIDAFYTYRHKRDANGNLVLDVDGDGLQTPIEMYVDQNGDGIINEKDLVANSRIKPNPDFVSGLTSTMNYRKFDLSFTFKGHFGQYVYNNVASNFGHFQRLTDLGVTNNIHASANETTFKNRQLFSDYYVQEASFVKLNNITLGYTFDQLRFGTVRAYVTGQNLLFLTPYKGVDPELSNGIDNNIYPRAIIATFGVNVTFK